jgi:hypothetical protein
MNLCMNKLHMISIINLSHIKFIMYNNRTRKSKGGSKSSFCVIKVIASGVTIKEITVIRSLTQTYNIMKFQ